MRFIAAVAIVVPILAAAYVLSRGPWPEPRAQTVATHAADSLTRARLDALRSGEVAAWGATLRIDALLLGDDADPARIGREEAVVEIRRELESWSATGFPRDLHVTGVTAHATRRGRLAWAASEVDGGASVAEDRPSRPLRLTTAYVFRDDEWRVMIEHQARAPSWEELQAGAASRRYPVPAALAAPEGRDAEQLARRFRRSLQHFGRMRVDRRAIAVGPARGDPAVGDSAVKAMIADWERRLGEPRLAEGGLLAYVPRRSGVGWVVANLETSPPGWGGAQLLLRLTAVYRERDEDNWGLVLAHLSVAMPEPHERAGASAEGAVGRY